MAERLGASPPQDLGTLKPDELSAAIRENVAGVAVGKAGAPIGVEGGIILIAVCGRTVPAAAAPDRESVMRQLRDRRLNLAAQRYLRDLRSAAIVDVRI